jgi:glucosyl-3-phosphoglycerate synthase
MVFDSGSNDGCERITREKGIKFIPDAQSAEAFGIPLSRGKGWNLWSSLYHLDTDIVLWVDADIQNINPRFVIGLIGPLLTDPELKVVKGYYKRPRGDARVTELMARPLISRLFPQLGEFIQPLSGEYGGRREALEQMVFYSGYSVEMALLIQCASLMPAEVAQVYLGERIHELQELAALGKMSASILGTVLTMAAERKLFTNLPESSGVLRQYVSDDGEHFAALNLNIADVPLPPMVTIPSYRRAKQW